LPEYGLIFDFDGTICLSETVHMDAWVVTAAKLSLPLPHDFIENGVGIADRHIAAELEKQWKHVLPADEILRLKCVEFRGRDAAKFPLVSGVLSFIQEAHRIGLPIALATSSAMADIEPVLTARSLRKYFSAVFTIESVVHPKPDPEIYLKASASLGIAPKKAFVFEDSIPGTTSARAAGCNVIGIGTAHKADELGELHGYIKTFDNHDMIFSQLLSIT
jgi:beta-phosphoglucomutase